VKRKRFSVEQIVSVFKQAELGCRWGADPPGWDHPLRVECLDVHWFATLTEANAE
jgi:hypothetical protein